MTVNITTPAESDMAEIARYIARDNPQRALSFVRELRDKCLSLEGSAHRFPVIRRKRAYDVRRRRHGRYQILFCLSDETIFVLRIVNDARDERGITLPDI